MKYLILSNSSDNNSKLIDAENILEAKKNLKKLLNRKNINQQFDIIDLVTSKKKHYIVKHN
jgi:hypothetical protein